MALFAVSIFELYSEYHIISKQLIIITYVYYIMNCIKKSFTNMMWHH